MTRPPIESLRTLFPLSDADREANERSALSAGQRAQLQGRANRLGIAASGLVGLGLILTTILLRGGFFAERGGIAIGAALGLLWLAALARTMISLLRLRLDLRAGQVAVAEGPVQHDFALTPGIIRMVKHHLRLGDLVFPMAKSQMFQFNNQQSYRVYYAPRSRVLLGAIAVGSPVPESPPPAAPAKTPPAPPLAEPLSGRELAILRLIDGGLSNQEIADQLHLSVNTVKMYASQLYAKLGVRRRTEALARARELGLI